MGCGRACVRLAARELRRFLGDEGASLVEVAVSLAVYLALLLGVIELLLAMYAYNFVSDAAREATRFAVIRGANSCVPSATFPNCNLGPPNVTSSTDPANNPVLQYIDSRRYPGLDPNNLSADVSWWLAHQDANGHTDWTTQCTGALDAKGNACNAEGNAVRVVVTYAFPLRLPWINARILKVSSTSQMVINF
jgi:Flp pilus assembly protein TadG